MKEIVLKNRKNGMLVLILTILLYILAFFGFIAGAAIVSAGRNAGVGLIILCILYICVGWIPLLGLKVLKPQEALVLTLFGRYVGTLKAQIKKRPARAGEPGIGLPRREAAAGHAKRGVDPHAAPADLAGGWTLICFT